MTQYECLTSNSSLASAIYAPFYPGLELTRYLWGGFNSSIKDAKALEFVGWLRGKPEWSRWFGRDHFFVAGRISWDFLRNDSTSENNWGNKLLNLPESKNMTVITIESTGDGEYEFSVPYPTNFHPLHDIELLEFQEQVRKISERPYLFAFAGAPRPRMRDSTRGELISQCKNSSDHNRCILINCRHNKSSCKSPTYISDMFRQSKFCLQSSGDSYTRRSTFDSILAGCIPVFFHLRSMCNQYLWHLPKNYTKYSVFIPEIGIKNGTIRVEEFLSKISEEVVLAMRKEVIKLIPKIVYARKKLENVEDAFDVSVSRVLQRIEKAKRLIQEG
ncbi:xyloglucan galactosyltransferase KATAMARI1 homolog [Amaranthus tricolor]|uniref:xyloglucan galactosyltransferase KATAMARI1 homolog n=1 Tax=Amaranthus tricolor TaxID=29722 RepID=UPI0025845FD4|nr:xyloglucan galactosyltransferase KATAMARI1 homolog [Amaranthus tricolor]